MPAISLLIKPASGLCDLRCKYCFYADVADHRDVKHYGIMKEDTVDQLIARAFEYSDTVVTFAFQGGEPTLAGFDYFRYFVGKVSALNEGKRDIHYAIQTNAMNITEDFAAFLAKHRFLVGVSLDGPKDIHDMNRVGSGGAGSFKTVRKAIKLLDKYKVDCNILTVVNKAVAKHPQKIYKYLTGEGFTYLQFIPCLDDLGEEHGSSAYALVPEDYGDFLCRIFDLWYADFGRGKRISIRMFDNILHILLGMPPESCDMVGRCSANIVVEADGSVYPCDFYVLDEWRLGMLQESSLMDLMTSGTANEFVQATIEKDDRCDKCEYSPICRGGCRRHRTQDINGDIGLNYFCSAYEKFYGYTLERFKEIASVLYREIR